MIAKSDADALSWQPVCAIRESRDLSSRLEYQDVLDDLYGHTNPLEETDEMKKMGTLQLERELQNISAKNKTAYIQALKECPDVVTKESGPIRFLRCENYNSKVCHLIACLHFYYLFCC